MIHVFEKRGWTAAAKKNGTCSVIFVRPDRTIIAMNRTKEVHKAWSPTPEVVNDFADLPGRGWYVFVAELLHNKVKGIKNVNYVHDILVADGEHLIGMTQDERQDLLHEALLPDDAPETPTHYVVSPSLWIPVEYESGFSKFYGSLTSDEDEGIVMKDPRQTLAYGGRASSNVVGQTKCRKYHKNYSF